MHSGGQSFCIAAHALLSANTQFRHSVDGVPMSVAKVDTHVAPGSARHLQSSVAASIAWSLADGVVHAIASTRMLTPRSHRTRRSSATLASRPSFSLDVP
jgi:hypothetical protein